ncbi:transcription initiation factor IIE, beta subunit [Clavulina sp. PMI_390]|nr:transcription initiation factor IIE, beta subunit [Clavulina sp. PMI_390]
MEAGSSGLGPSRALPLNPDWQPKKKKQRTKQTQVWSQPADTGMGSHEGTKIVMLLDILKKRNGPINFNDLNILSNNVLDNADVLARFEAHDSVTKTFQTAAVASRDDLVKEIKSHSRRGGGLSVASLKQRWPGAPDVIQQLEDEGLILVTRSTKEGGQGQPKMVFWNDIQSPDGKKQQIESEFLTMWNDLKWPAENDLERALNQLGQTPARTTPNGVLAPVKERKKKTKAPRTRQVKFQNTHLDIDLSRDYVPPPPEPKKL